MTNIFDSTNYKIYLSAAFGEKRLRSGMRKRAADHMGIQSAYLSQVLNGSAHLSLEQAHKLSDFLSHDTEQRDYFILLIQLARAGSSDLRRYFQNKAEEIQARRLVIRERLKASTRISPEDQSTYYSRWYYACIHVMVSVPGLQTSEAIATHLKLPLKAVVEALNFLESRKFVIFEKGAYRIGPRHFHLPHDSPHIGQHHGNWRSRALNSMDAPRSDDLHYSVVVTLSKADVKTIKARIVDLIQENMRTIKDSKEEKVFACTIDYFEV